MDRSSPKQSAVLLPVAAVALAAGFGIGWLSSNNSNISSGDENNNNNDGKTKCVKTPIYCECGFDLTGLSPEYVARHKGGKQHAFNLHRSSGPPILVTGKINEYRAAISTYALPTDVILEVGCAEGLTTQRLAVRCRIAIGIDQNSNLISKGQARLVASSTSKINPRDGSTPDWSNLHLFAGDAFDLQTVTRIVDKALGPTSKGDDGVGEMKQKGSSSSSHGGKINKIWLDISGSRKLDAVVSLIRSLEGLLQPDLIVVKSHHLKNLVLRSHLPNSTIPGLPTNDIMTCQHSDGDQPYVLA